MNTLFAIVTAEHCYLRQGAGISETVNETGIEDEIFSGWAVRLISEEENGWVHIETHYGYTGYVRTSELRIISEAELKDRQDKNRFFRIGAFEADLLSIPKVQGLPKELIQKNAIVELLEQAEDGWSHIRTAAGNEGYVHTVYLKKRKDDDDFLLKQETTASGYFRKRFLNLPENEYAFRSMVTNSALAYLGTQYRWGGKSSQGLDCSGLAFMSYFENGILIYRDANIKPDFPMQEITVEMLKPADLIFFPGHVAIYLGDGKFVHSTGYSKTPCVTINSLNPVDDDYRADLAQNITACGSLFHQKEGSL